MYGTCRLCGTEKNLVKAHIIAKCFYEYAKTGVPYKIVSSIPDTYSKRSWTGIWDNNILCSECDNRIGVWEEYAYKALKLPPPSGKVQIFDQEPLGYPLENYNYNFLKLCILSTLFKMHLSTHPVFSAVNLGERYEFLLRDRILSENGGAEEDFATLIARFDYPNEKIPTLYPQKERIDSVVFYRIYFLNYIVWIKIDKQSSPPVLRKSLLAEGSLYIILRNFEKSKERALMKNIIEKFKSAEKGTV